MSVTSDVGRSVDVPVLVVGGGPVGLLMATGLRNFGIDCLLVEKHVSTLDFPKGRRVTTRTVEIFRQWGLEAAVAKVSLPRADSLFSFEGETLLACDYRRQGLPFDDVNRTSPTRELICSQESLEPVLRERAKADADVRFSAEVVGFTQDGDRVIADAVMAGEHVSVHASYMVAADGAHGRTRDALGIDRSGPGTLGHRLSILVNANMATRMMERQSAVYWLRQPRPGSLFVAVDNKDRWLLSVPYDPDTEPKDSWTELRCLELVRGGLGDEHNLAWKLAGVIAGWASPALLETYEPERRTHAVACADASLGPARPPNPIDGLVLGHAFESAAIINDHTPAPRPQDPVGEYLPVARPGHRAPHIWLDPETSTLDLFGHAFVALTDPVGKPGLDHAADVARATGIPLTVHAVDVPGWHDLYGVGSGGVVLVRPDGYVAWRSTTPPATSHLLASALRTAAGHRPSLDPPPSMRARARTRSSNPSWSPGTHRGGEQYVGSVGVGNEISKVDA